MIEERYTQVLNLQKDVQGMQDSMKEQYKEKEDIILRLTKEDNTAMKKMIELETKIQMLEKKTEKVTSETIQNYESQKN